MTDVTATDEARGRYFKQFLERKRGRHVIIVKCAICLQDYGKKDLQFETLTTAIKTEIVKEESMPDL